jgi:hypothetical protein
MMQYIATSDDNIVSILDCVDENLSEVESSYSGNEIGDNKKSDHKSGTSDSENGDGQATMFFSGWHDVKWQVKIWLLGVPQLHGVHNKKLY